MSSNISTRHTPCRAIIASQVALMMILVLSACNRDTSAGKKHPDTASKPSFEQKGEASWYGPGFHGEETASGETFNQNKMTAAHPTLPLGSKAEVTNLETGKSVEVIINDRGPYANNRVIDLSKAAAKKIGMTKDGTAEVAIESKSAKKSKTSNKTSNKTSSKTSSKTSKKNKKPNIARRDR
jgi:rare lipoprotein A